MLDYLGLTPGQLPEICGHGQPVGTVCRSAARATGLAPETVVVTGALDQICGMMGVGNIAPGMISESTGTVLAVHTLADKFFAGKDEGIHNFCHVRAGRYAWIGVCPTACSALDWFMDILAGDEQMRMQQALLDQLSRKAAGVPPGSDGLILLPHLAGSGSPRPNPSARGVFYGVQLHHKREHFFRALLEAIACELKSNIEVFRRNGLALREIRSFGGGSRNRLWNQIKADICGLPVVTSNCPEPGCLGAAILAGVGVGMYKHIEEGVRRLVVLNRPQYPDGAAVRRYESLYQAYKKLERNMTPMYGS